MVKKPSKLKMTKSERDKMNDAYRKFMRKYNPHITQAINVKNNKSKTER